MIVEIRKKKSCGEAYPPNSLYQLCSGIERYFRENDRPEINLFENWYFEKFQDLLKAEIKRLTAQEHGIVVKVVEEKLWNLKLLGDHSPQVLLDTMVFMIGRNFSLRDGKDHRNLHFEQLTLVEDSATKPKKLLYNSFGEKNSQGGLKHLLSKGKKN